VATLSAAARGPGTYAHTAKAAGETATFTACVSFCCYAPGRNTTGERLALLLGAEENVKDKVRTAAER